MAIYMPGHRGKNPRENLCFLCLLISVSRSIVGEGGQTASGCGSLAEDARHKARLSGTIRTT